MALAPPTLLVGTAKTSALKAPHITTTALPTATVGKAYSASLAATGGTPPYTWGLNDGQLPAGLLLSPSGLITGVPIKTGPISFDVLCTDSSK